MATPSTSKVTPSVVSLGDGPGEEALRTQEILPDTQKVEKLEERVSRKSLLDDLARPSCDASVMWGSYKDWILAFMYMYPIPDAPKGNLPKLDSNHRNRVT